MRNRQKQRHRGGVLVTVLFVVMAISVISLGVLARTDMNLACGRNLSLKIQTDWLAYSGLQCARAMAAGPDSPVPFAPWSGPAVFDGLESDFHCELTIGAATATAGADPNEFTYLYPVMCRAYKQRGSDVLAESIVYGSLFHDPQEARACYISVHR